MENQNQTPKNEQESHSQQGADAGPFYTEEEEQKYDLDQLKVSDYLNPPININGSKEMINFIQSGVLKGIENIRMRERFLHLITSERVGKLMRLSFWFIFNIKFQKNLCTETPELREKVQIDLRKKISKTYVKIFSDLPQPKEELISQLIFCISYISHYLFYKFFSKQKQLFNIRFVLDCYHILVFEFTGLYVSDHYIRIQIDRFFNNNFLSYENKRKPKQIQQRVSKDSFLGHKLIFPDISTSVDGQQFQKVINDKLRLQRKNQNTLQTEETHILNDLSATQLGVKQLNLTNNINNQNEVPTGMESKQPGNAITLTQPPTYFSNLQLNCNQISPTVSKVLMYENMSLPCLPKKMIRHAFDNVNHKEETLINKLKLFSKTKSEQREVKQIKFQPRNFIDQFNLRPPPKEYYQKHSKLDKMFKGMLDMNYVFQNYSEGLPQLHSSLELQKKLEETKMKEFEEQKLKAEQQKELEAGKGKTNSSVATGNMQNQSAVVVGNSGSKMANIAQQVNQSALVFPSGGSNQLTTQQLQVANQQQQQSILKNKNSVQMLISISLHEPDLIQQQKLAGSNTTTNLINEAAMTQSIVTQKQQSSTNQLETPLSPHAQEKRKNSFSRINAKKIIALGNTIANKDQQQNIQQQISPSASASNIINLDQRYSEFEYHRPLKSHLIKHDDNTQSLDDIESPDEDGDLSVPQYMKNKNKVKLYDDKRKIYRQKYENINENGESIDNNINSLEQKIKVKQNMINKYMIKNIKKK